jgi:hypothetical protein
MLKISSPVFRLVLALYSDFRESSDNLTVLIELISERSAGRG